MNYSKAFGENAPGIMTILYYDDLVSTKNIIFEMAEMDDKQLKMPEASYLIHQLKLYFLKANETDEKYKLLECFNRTPDKFKHMDIIKQIESENLKLENFY
jgi:ATP synthase F1 complex assembly factor 1